MQQESCAAHAKSMASTGGHSVGGHWRWHCVRSSAHDHSLAGEANVRLAHSLVGRHFAQFSLSPALHSSGTSVTHAGHAVPLQQSLMDDAPKMRSRHKHCTLGGGFVPDSRHAHHRTNCRTSPSCI